MKKESLKIIVAVGLTVSGFGGLFVAANNYVFASSIDKPISIPTSYQETSTLTEEPKDYKKSDYKIVTNELLSCTNANALSKEKAGELGAQYLWDVFQVDLNNKVIYLSFSVDPSRGIAYWYGDVYENESEIKELLSLPEYNFCIEAISGKRNTIQRNYNSSIAKETILYKESDADTYYKNNCKEFFELAKKAAEKQMSSMPVKAEYNGTAAVLAPGFEFETPEGKTNTFTVQGQDTEESNLIKVSPDGEFEASYVFVNILVTDENGNQVEVEFDVRDKSVISISNIYTGIDYDPNSVG